MKKNEYLNQAEEATKEAKTNQEANELSEEEINKVSGGVGVNAQNGNIDEVK